MFFPQQQQPQAQSAWGMGASTPQAGFPAGFGSAPTAPSPFSTQSFSSFGPQGFGGGSSTPGYSSARSTSSFSNLGMGMFPTTPNPTPTPTPSFPSSFFQSMASVPTQRAQRAPERPRGGMYSDRSASPPQYAPGQAPQPPHSAEGVGEEGGEQGEFPMGEQEGPPKTAKQAREEKIIAMRDSLFAERESLSQEVGELEEELQRMKDEIYNTSREVEEWRSGRAQQRQSEEKEAELKKSAAKEARLRPPAALRRSTGSKGGSPGSRSTKARTSLGRADHPAEWQGANSPSVKPKLSFGFRVREVSDQGGEPGSVKLGITRVLAGGPAARVGLSTGDLLDSCEYTEQDGSVKRLTGLAFTKSSLLRLVNSLQCGDVVTFRVFTHEGKCRKVALPVDFMTEDQHTQSLLPAKEQNYFTLEAAARFQADFEKFVSHCQGLAEEQCGGEVANNPTAIDRLREACLQAQAQMAGGCRGVIYVEKMEGGNDFYVSFSPKEVKEQLGFDIAKVDPLIGFEGDLDEDW